jgi:hypothetical protein
MYGNGAWKNKLGASLQTTYGEKYKNTNYDGLQPFIDLKAKGRIDSAPTVYVALNKKEKNIATNNTLGIAQGSTNISEKGTLQNSSQFSLAKGAAYFERAQDIETTLTSNVKREFGNLYNPFWVPKLEKSNSLEAQSMHVIAKGG